MDPRLFEQWRRFNVVCVAQEYYLSSVNQRDADLWFHFIRHAPHRHSSIGFHTEDIVIEYNPNTPVNIRPTVFPVTRPIVIPSSIAATTGSIDSIVSSSPSSSQDSAPRRTRSRCEY